MKWLPSAAKVVSGEVKGDCILIYDEDEEVALETLKHEFVDYALSRVVEPYKEFVNQLVALINNMAYERKEELVDALTRLI